MGEKKSLFGQIYLSISCKMSQIIHIIEDYFSLCDILFGKETILDIVYRLIGKVLNQYLFENLMLLLFSFCLPLSQSCKCLLPIPGRQTHQPLGWADRNLVSPWHWAKPVLSSSKAAETNTQKLFKGFKRSHSVPCWPGHRPSWPWSDYVAEEGYICSLTFFFTSTRNRVPLFLFLF